MDESQVPKEKPKEGCGCGNANAKYVQGERLTEQQEKLISRIQKTSQRKNSIYKTNIRYFM